MEPPLPPQAKYADLLKWLRETMVLVKEDYVEDSQQPIRNLFGKLGLFFKFIQKFITFRNTNTSRMAYATLQSMSNIIAEMSKLYEKVPREISPDYPDHPKGIIYPSSEKYKSFFEKSWKPMIRDLLEQYKKDEFLTFFLENFGSYYDSNIRFDRRLLQNFETLFSEIAKVNDTLANQLYETYCLDILKYNHWYEREIADRGGRKLSRRRRSIPKSKSKHKHKRRSYKKGSYRRQRH